MTAAEAALVLALAVWLLATLIWQLQVPAVARLRPFDIFGLVPAWTFFAPNPGTTDYHVVYRDRRPDGTVTEWRELPLLSARRAADAVWNPSKRQTKLLSDCVNAIAHMVALHRRRGEADQGYDELCLTVPYLMILNAVSRAPLIEAGATHRHFAIVETSGHLRSADPKPLLFSAFHQLSHEFDVAA